MDKIIDYLKQLELSDIEAKIYLALLKTGTTGVRELASSVDVKRTTAYLYIDQLVEKGLVIKIVKGSRKQVSAIKPQDSLNALVNQKLISAELTQKQFPTMIEELKSFAPEMSASQDAEIKYLKGKNSVKKIYEEVLQAKEVRSYVDISKINEIFPENFQLFNNAFQQNPEIIMYEIVENSKQSKNYIEFSSAKEKYFQKLLPKDVKLTAQDILIYDNKVAIIYLNDKVTGVVLHSADLYNNFKMLFDFIWKVLPDK